jgi:hypothetical protein
MAAGLLAVAVATIVIGALTGHPALLEWTSGLFVALLPVATGAAILRYRLYDLDRIVSRTLAYGLLGGGYAAVVLGLGQLLGGRQSSLVVAGATLAVAALFQPARRHVQQAVDRRFNRRRFDAARTIAAFSARLRQEVDLDALSVELLAVVEETMQPTQASLWLRPALPSGAAGRRRGPAAHLKHATGARTSGWPAGPSWYGLGHAHHPEWLPGQAEVAAEGGAGRRSAKNAAAWINPAKRTLRRGRTHSPEGRHTAPDAPNPRATVHEATRRSTCHGLDPPSGPPEATAASAYPSACRERRGRHPPAEVPVMC